MKRLRFITHDFSNNDDKFFTISLVARTRGKQFEISTLLTKGEVKTAGYWLRGFYAFSDGPRRGRS